MGEAEPVTVREKVDEPGPEPEAAPLVRLAIGGTILAGRKVAELLAEWTEMAAAQLEEAQTPEEAASVRHVLIGLAAATSSLAKAAIDIARPTAEKLLESARDKGGGLPTPVRAIVDELSDLGTKEEAQSIALAHTAFSDAVERVFAALSESPELGDLIREQTASFGRDAVDELRDVALRADQMTEAALRRLVRKTPREPDELAPVAPNE